MGTISTGVGLASNLPIGDIVDALINAQKTPILRLTQRAQQFISTETGLKTLSANMLTLTGTLDKLGEASTFDKLSASVSDNSVLKVSPSPKTPVGTYEFEAIRKVSTQQVHSRGFANADVQTVGEGVITIASGGKLSAPTPLDVLNGGSGVRRGVFRVTDRSGASAEIDITDAVSVTDVLDLINSHSGISVEARVSGDGITIEDKTGSNVASLQVEEVSGGHAAEDLGILKSAAGTTLTGDAVRTIADNYTLDLINDGNGLQLVDGAADIRITLSDDPTTELDIDLDEAVTLKDVVDAINNHEDNDGKVLAELIDGRFVLTDQTAGGGPAAFQVTDINEATVVHELGLDVQAVGGTISGEAIVGGLDSVLLKNLLGGQGIDQLGSISLTDRSGKSAVIDLSNAISLHDVLNAINTAEDNGAQLNLTATFDDQGTGIRLIDTTSAPSGNLIIADTANSTLAAQLGIEIDAAESSIETGSLNLRYVNEGTLLDGYAPGGGKPQTSAFTITDSAGNAATVSITTSVKNIGDVIQRINAASGIEVVAQLNETGDGFEIVDLADGEGELKVEDLGGGKAAEGLRLLGDSFTDIDGKQHISSRLTVEIEVTAEDTLNDIVEKLNGAQAGLTAAVIDDGSTLNPKRLVLNSDKSGLEGALIIDTQGFDLGLETFVEAQDAVLRVGSDPATAFISTSSTNRFNAGINALIDIEKVSQDPVTVVIERDPSSVNSAVKAFVDSYNRIVNTAEELTKFDQETGERGALQGEGIVLRILNRLDTVVTRRTGDGSNEFRSLLDLGVSITVGGKLRLDEDVLQAALDENPNLVRDFFTEAENGFADRFTESIDSFADPFTGSLTYQTNALQESLKSLETRIGDLNDILARKRERLVQQFSRLETVISSLNSQQSAIDRLSSLATPVRQSSS